MRRKRRIDPSHAGTRDFLRIAGPILLVGGLVLIVFANADMLGLGGGEEREFRQPDLTFDGFERNARRMHEDFEASKQRNATRFGITSLGMLLVFVGGVMTKFGYMGRVARYAAAEIAPVGKDVINYMGDEAAPGVRSIASAVGEGIREGMSDGGSAASAEQVVRCHKCNKPNDVNAKFCDSCGAALLKSAPCPDCNELNDGDARFCDNCGAKLT